MAEETQMSDVRRETTHQAILKAYCQMLSENKQPTILSLAKQAQIGRRTFYAFYSDIHGVYAELFRYLLVTYDRMDKDKRRNPVRMAIGFLDYLHSLPLQLKGILKGDCSIYVELIDTIASFHPSPMILSSLYHLALGMYRQWLREENTDYALLREAASDLLSIGYRGYSRKRPTSHRQSH